jgi:hypothetical protein
MKKFLLAIFIFSCIAETIAQEFDYVGEGRFLAGGKGSLKFDRWEYLAGENAKETSVRFSPNFGYFFINKWAAGVNLDFESSSTKYPNQTDKDTYNEVGIGLFTRYYLCPVKSRKTFFGEAGFNVGGYKYNDQDRINYNSFFLGAAFACFINRYIALELGLEYRSHKYEDEDERSTRFGLCAGFQMMFGPCGRVETVAKATY